MLDKAKTSTAGTSKGEGGCRDAPACHPIILKMFNTLLALPETVGYSLAINNAQENEMKLFKVTLENFNGKCKRVKVLAESEYEAMALCQKNGWYPVEVQIVE